ncbi:MAG: nitroreductase family protein [Turicibacter sp.]|nr:nitroreductase family protein [Turicibacter sp.]
MNETLKTITERYSCRGYTGDPLKKEEIEQLVKAALASPSAVNRQPWRVIVCTDKALIDEMDAAGVKILEANEDKTSYNRIMERGGKMLYNAPCMITIVADDTPYAIMDSGIMVQNMALAAHSMGLGNVICAMARILFEDDKYKKALNFPDGYKFAVSILVGKANTTKEPHELDFSKVSYV